MDVLEAIRHRRSIRKYKSDSVEDDKLNKILEAGRWAPSASNKQPWHFIIIKDDEMRKKLADIHTYGRFMAESPVVIVVLGDKTRHEKYHLADPHNAVQNMLLAAHSLELATCWMGVRDTAFESTFRELLEIPENYRVVCSISLGYPAMERDSSRLSLNEIVSWEKFGGQT
jgi:nitroreductase